MPCRDYDAEEQDRREQVTRLHETTRMLCAVMTHVENGTITSLDDVDGLARWWADHKKADRERARREAEANARSVKELRAEIADRQRRLDALTRT